MRRHDRRFNPQLSLVRHGCFPFRTDRRADSADRRVAENVNPVATAFRSIEPPAARAEAQDPLARFASGFAWKWVFRGRRGGLAIGVRARNTSRMRPGYGALFGRERDVDRLRMFVADATVSGGALLLSGDPGVGKTALLDIAASSATEARHRVLRAGGAQFEADLSFAGLHQVLHPLLGGLDRLSGSHRRALGVALGLVEGESANQLVVSSAALELLLDSTDEQAVVLLIDDLQWLDRSSALVLGFAARRLVGTQVAFLAAYRTGEEMFFERGGMESHELQPLDEQDALALLHDRFPALARRARERLVTDAQGNPLALLELPISLSAPQRADQGALPKVLALSERLQALFEARISALPDATRRQLLWAVLDGADDLRVLPTAGTALGDGVLATAERARLVGTDPATGRITFRHPLIRSAIVNLSTSDDRRHVHRELADHHVNELERRAWHLGEAALEADEHVAKLLEQAAQEITETVEQMNQQTRSVEKAVEEVMTLGLS